MAGKTVCVAVDLHQATEATVEWVAQHALPPGGKLTVLTVQPGAAGAGAAHPPPEGTQSAVEKAKQACRERFPKAQEVDVAVAREGSSEAIGEAIIERVRATHASLLVVAPHKHSASERVLKGSVTDWLIRRAPLPVLVVQGVPGVDG